MHGGFSSNVATIKGELMDVHVHIVSISQIWDYLSQHKGAIVLAWLAAIKILTAVQDAIDVMPSGLKPPFGKLIYLMKATIPYLGWGNRIKPISDTPVAVSTTMPQSAGKVVPIIVFFFLLSSSAWAHNTTTNTTIVNNTQVNPTAVVVAEKVQAGPMVDAPYLVRVFPDWYIGVEGGKDEVYTNPSKGWFGYVKVTWTRTLLDLSQRKDN